MLKTLSRLRGDPGGGRLDIVIVGAGFSGIAMALALKDAGHGEEFLIVDRAEEFGGTWRDNVYPGCACDVPSPVYSLRGEPHDWERFFAPQPNIQDYILKVVDKHGLRRHARLGTEVIRQTWDADTATWLLETGDGDTLRADVVINGIGPLTKAVIPDIPGVEDFAGPAFHSAAWRHDVDLSGKRVGVIGTGASAVQIIPEIVDTVASLTVFQRTPSWVLPKLDRAFSPIERWALRHIPGLHQGLRWTTNLVLEYGVWRMLARNRKVAERIRRTGIWNIERAVEDPQLRAELRPQLEPGCKRIMLSNTYYPALARVQTTLETAGIARITPGGVVLTDGRAVELEVIVWGTGFDAHHFWAPMEVIGSNGVKLDEVWAEAATAYNSTATPGFPNNFFLLGPNSGTGHNSVIMMAEAQVDYIMQALAVLRSGQAAWLAPTPAATRAYAHELRRRHEDLVWASGCGSWYRNDDGVNDVLYPGRVGHYQRRLRRFDLAAYETGDGPATGRT